MNTLLVVVEEAIESSSDFGIWLGACLGGIGFVVLMLVFWSRGEPPER